MGTGAPYLMEEQMFTSRASMILVDVQQPHDTVGNLSSWLLLCGFHACVASAAPGAVLMVLQETEARRI